MGTTSRRGILQQLDFDSVFNKEIAVPSVRSLSELEIVLEDQKVFNDPGYLVETMNLVAEATQGSNEVNLGIKSILEIAGSAKVLRDEEKVNFLADELGLAMASTR